MAALISCEASSVDLAPVLTPEDAAWDDALANGREVDGLLAHLEKMLVGIDYHDPQNPGTLMARIKRLLLRSKLDKMDVNILRGVCKAALNKSKP